MISTTGTVGGHGKLCMSSREVVEYSGEVMTFSDLIKP